MKGKDGRYWCVDDTPADFQEGLLSQAADSQALYHQYFQAVLDSLQADLGDYAPNRIGHMTLIKKFQDYFQLDANFSSENFQLIAEILKTVKKQQRELDLNAARD